MSFLVLYGFLRLHLQAALVGRPGCQEVPAQRHQRSIERVVDHMVKASKVSHKTTAPTPGASHKGYLFATSSRILSVANPKSLSPRLEPPLFSRTTARCLGSSANSKELAGIRYAHQATIGFSAARTVASRWSREDSETTFDPAPTGQF